MKVETWVWFQNTQKIIDHQFSMKIHFFVFLTYSTLSWNTSPLLCVFCSWDLILLHISIVGREKQKKKERKQAIILISW